MSLTKDLESKLHEYILRAHALEMQVLRQLDLTINSTTNQDMLALLRRHRAETKDHLERLEQRFGVHNIEASDLREVGGVVGALCRRERAPTRHPSGAGGPPAPGARGHRATGGALS